MKTIRFSAARWTLALTVAAVAGFLLPSAGAQTYTVTKVVDSNTPLPGGAAGSTFLLSSTANGVTSPAMDGDAVVFYNEDSVDNSYSAQLWSVQATGTAAPVRLVDSSTTAPGNSGPFTTAYSNGSQNLAVGNVSGGNLLFAGFSPEGYGYYTIPVAGGAIATVVNPAKTQPNVQSGPSFEHLGQAVLRGSQAFFEVEENDYLDGEGMYATPVAGGAYTVLADKTTLITGDANGTLYPGGAFLSVNDGLVSFEPKLYYRDFTGNSAVYTAPATGLTVSSQTGFVNNATRIAGGETLVPGDPQGRSFDARYLDSYLDDSGAVVFTGYAEGADLTQRGIYVSINGVVNRLVDTTSSLAGDAGHFEDVAFEGATVGHGQVVFLAGYVLADGTETPGGIYTVPVAGGAVRKVVVNGDTLADGSTISPYDFGPFGLSSNGKIAFHGSYTKPSGATVYAIFVATPGGGSSPSANTLVLNTHKGGDTGPVTLIVTPAPGAAALVAGATFKLSAAGEPDIAGSNAVLNAAGTAYTVTFDLKGQADALYDLVVTNPDGSTATQSGVFTVEPGTGPILYQDILGRDKLRAGTPQIYTFLVGNRGDTDAAMVPLYISFPSYFSVKLITTLGAIPAAAQVDPTFDLSQLPLATTNGDHQVLSLYLPKIPAGTIQTVQVLFGCPDVFQYAHVPFTLSAQSGEPTIDAETLMPPAGSDPEAANPNGEHRESVGLAATCALSLANLAIDCASAVVPGLQGLKCGETLTLAAFNIAAGVSSDNNSYDSIALSYYQAEATGIIALVHCAVGITPGVGNVLNAAQCVLDAVLLEESCVTPAIFLFAQTIVSGDPNDLVGSLGDGTAAHYLTGAQPLRYAVYFENEATASAPAQAVTITNALDANLDLSTFSLGPIGFGSTVLNPPTGATSYTTTVDLRPGTNLLVQVTANLDVPSRLLTYHYQSLDPATNQPPTDPTVGFLPPDTNAPAGDGFAVFSASPVAGLSTGTTINDQASIVFDANAAIATPTWTNTIDNDAPSSSLAALTKPLTKSAIKLKVTGTDVGSGIAYYNVYVSEDGGNFLPLVKNAAGPEITYNGVTGHKYAFFSQAVDLAGNLEPLKTAAEAKTKIKGADLIGSWDGAVTEQTTASGKFKLKGRFTVMNQSGNAATANGSVVRFYLCASSTFDGSQTVIGKDAAFGVLAGGASVDVALGGAKLTSATQASGQYVIAVIDPDKQVKETDRTNDQVSYGPLP